MLEICPNFPRMSRTGSPVSDKSSSRKLRGYEKSRGCIENPDVRLATSPCPYPAGPAAVVPAVVPAVVVVGVAAAAAAGAQVGLGAPVAAAVAAKLLRWFVRRSFRWSFHYPRLAQGPRRG